MYNITHICQWSMIMASEANSKNLFLYMIPASVFWSGAFIAGKISVQEIPPYTLTFIRFLLASIIVIPIMLQYEKNNWRLNRKDLPGIFLIGFIGIFLYHVLFFIALQYTDAINASLISAASPMVTSIMASVTLKEGLGLKRIFAIALAFSGVLLTITKGKLDLLFGLNLNMGDVIMLIAVLCQASYAILSKRVMVKHSPIVILSYSFASGLLILIPFVIYENPLTSIHSISSECVWAVVYMAIFPSAIAYLLQQLCLKNYGASKTNLFINLVPLFAIIAATVILNEEAGMITFVSAFIIIVGVYVNSTVTQKALQKA